MANQAVASMVLELTVALWCCCGGGWEALFFFPCFSHPSFVPFLSFFFPSLPLFSPVFLPFHFSSISVFFVIFFSFEPSFPCQFPPLSVIFLSNRSFLYVCLFSLYFPLFFSFFLLVERGIYRIGEAGATLPLSNPGDRVGRLKWPLYNRLSCPQGSPI